MKTSVIMAEYNTQQDHLKEAIESILGQTYKTFEFIIILDGPNLASEEIIKSYQDKRIRLIYNQQNKGLVYSLNRAIKVARGEYLIRMDTDDIALPNRLKILVGFLDSNREYDVVGSKAVEFSGSKEYGVLGISGEKTRSMIMRGDTLVHPSVAMRKKIVKSVGGYPDYLRSEDLALWCELLLAGSKIYIVDCVLLKYRVNSEDYKKRTIKNRLGELNVRMHYYPMLGAGLFEYFRILKSIIAGIIPTALVRQYRHKVVLRNKRSTDE